MTEPMSEKRLGKIRIFIEAMGDGIHQEMLLEIYRHREQVATLKTEHARLLRLVGKYERLVHRAADNSKAANAVCEELQRDAIDGEELGRLLEAYRAAKRALARIQSCKNVEVVCDDA